MVIVILRASDVQRDEREPLLITSHSLLRVTPELLLVPVHVDDMLKNSSEKNPGVGGSAVGRTPGVGNDVTAPPVIPLPSTSHVNRSDAVPRCMQVPGG